MADMTFRLHNRASVLDRLRFLSAQSEPTSPAIRAALTRAALLIVNQAKINIRRHGLIDTGRLLNSLRFEFYRPDEGGMGVRIGSFGVPYAAVWEGLLGTKIPIRGHTRIITKAFGKSIPATAVAVRAHFRSITPKPFLRPAFEQHKYKVSQIILAGLG